jgi:LuxR family transcriptional regulator, maltose regulon positive regulatory protein
VQQLLLAALAGAQRPAPAEAAPAAEPAMPSRLSVRECEVLARIAAGDSNKAIARTLALSPHTVKRHVANILDKLDLRSRGQAAAWYHEHVAGH